MGGSPHSPHLILKIQTARSGSGSPCSWLLKLQYGDNAIYQQLGKQQAADAPRRAAGEGKVVRTEKSCSNSCQPNVHLTT